MTEVINNRARFEQLKQAWIKNVMKKAFLSEESAEAMFQRIKPYILNPEWKENPNAKVE